jgi:hypothetical protein
MNIYYRAMPIFADYIRDGDYITKSKKFAIEHAITSSVYNAEDYGAYKFSLRDDQVSDGHNPGEYRYSGRDKFAALIGIAKYDDKASDSEFIKTFTKTASVNAMISDLIKLADTLDGISLNSEINSIDLLIKKLSSNPNCEKLYQDALELRDEVRVIQERINGLSRQSRIDRLTGSTTNPRRGTLSFATIKYNEAVRIYSESCSGYVSEPSTNPGGSNDCDSSLQDSNSLTEAHNSLVDEYEACVEGVREEYPGAPYNQNSDPVERCQSIQDSIDLAGERERAARESARTDCANRDVNWNVSPK